MVEEYQQYGELPCKKGIHQRNNYLFYAKMVDASRIQKHRSHALS